MSDDRILLVDGTNNFLRCYSGDPFATPNGLLYGGVRSFLKSIGNAVCEADSTKVVVIFDGKNGSVRRRAINPDYKANRKPKRLHDNRHFEIDDPEENMRAQMFALKDYLTCLPVSVICIDNIEADDVIGYLWLMNPDARKVIFSNDKDFYQLLDKTTVIYRPQIQNYQATHNCLEQFQVHPINFTVARAIDGDPSDNLKGVPGWGFKSIVKYLPFLANTNKVYTCEDVFAFCSQQKHPRYKKFLDHRKRVTDNYEIMNIRRPLISLSSIGVIKSAVDNCQSFKRVQFLEKMIRDGLDISDKLLDKFRELQGMNERCQMKSQ